MKIYIVSESHRFLNDVLEIDNSIELVTRDYNEALDKFKGVAKSWDIEEMEITKEEECIYAERYDDDGDGVTIELLSYEV